MTLLDDFVIGGRASAREQLENADVHHGFALDLRRSFIERG